MSTIPSHDQPLRLGLHNPTLNNPIKKRKAEETLPSPCSQRRRFSNQPAVTTSTINPTHPSPHISICQLPPHSKHAAFSSMVQRAVDSSYLKHVSSTTPHLPRNDPIKDNGGMADMLQTIDLTSEFNTSHRTSSTRAWADSVRFGASNRSEEISKVTAEISETVEARKLLYVIDYHLQKILHEMAQVEGAVMEVARAKRSTFIFSSNIYELKEQIALLRICQQHMAEESFGEQAFLSSKLRNLRELSNGQERGVLNFCSQSVYRPLEEVHV